MAVSFHRAARRPLTHRLHDHDRPDDYHWLKTQGRQDAEVLAYLEGENTYLDSVLHPHREEQQRLYQELLSHVQEDDEQPPVREGDWWYYTRTEQGLAHKIFMRQPVAGGEAQELLNLNNVKEREGLANVWVYFTRPSPNGRYFAYLLDSRGYEEWELRVLDTFTGRLLEEPLVKVGGWTLTWSADSTQLYYTTDDETKRPDCLWRHTLGQPRSADELLFQENDPTFMVGADISENGESLFIHCSANKTDEWYAVNAHNPQGKPQLVIPRERGTETPLLADGGDHWLALTNQGNAAEFKVVQLPKTQTLDWFKASELLPYAPARHLTGLKLFKHHLLLAGRQDGLRRLWVLARSAQSYGEAQAIHFPDESYSVYIGENLVFDSATARILYTSLVQPTQHLDLDLASGHTSVVKTTPVPSYDQAQYLTQQVWAQASDGERLPISLIRRKDTPLPAPTVLNGYGSYGMPFDPTFDREALPLLDRGFVWAIAHIRGGSELGRRWYDAGRLEHKMNTFTDFIAAAKHLKDAGISGDVVASGRSAGGLLMGAVINLAPSLWKAAIMGVPFVDVLSTMLDASLPLTTSEYDEWGNPNDTSAYATMREYSPYDNMQATNYPHLFVTTGLNDPRVSYWEPAKYVARLRDLAQADSGKMVLKTNFGAGHGGSSGRYDALNETAEEQAFILAAVKGTL